MIPGRSRDRIAGSILQAHDRIARQYGHTDLDGEIQAPSYAHWNLERNGFHFMRHIWNRYWSPASRSESFRLLDAGCGNGQFSQFFLRLGVPLVIGFDFSSGMLKTAVERLMADRVADRFLPVRIDLSDLSAIQEKSMDGGFLFGVIEHLDEPNRVLCELLRVLRPGARLVVSFPRWGSMVFFSYLFFGQSVPRWGTDLTWRDCLRWREKLRFYRFFRKREITALLTALNNARLVTRIPFAWSHLEGLPAGLYTRRARRGEKGYRWLDRWERCCSAILPIPGAEYVVLERL